MAKTFAYIRTAADLGETDLARAASERSHFRAMVERLAEVARPNDGAEALLILCARIVQDPNSWLEGMLRVKLAADGSGTRGEFLCEDAGLIERLFPATRFEVTASEFAKVANRCSSALSPLFVESASETQVNLIGAREIELQPLMPPTRAATPPPPSERAPSRPSARPTRANMRLDLGELGRAPNAAAEPLPQVSALTVEQAEDDEERPTVPGEPPSILIRESRVDEAPTAPPPAPDPNLGAAARSSSDPPPATVPRPMTTPNDEPSVDDLEWDLGDS